MSADPFTLALLFGGGLQAAGAIQEGRIAKAQGSFAKKIALRNQAALERQAKAEESAAAIEERRIARQEKIVKGKQRAAVGKSGVGLVGATLAVLTDTAVQFSIDRNLALRRGLFKSRELRQRGRIIAAQGRFAKTMGTRAQRLSYFKAGGSILGAIGTAGLLSPSTAGVSRIGSVSTPGSVASRHVLGGFGGGF